MNTATDNSNNGSTINEDRQAASKSDSLVFSLTQRLLFPTLALVFVLMYVNNTWGRIDFRNLWYPYFIVACALTLLLSIYATEILTVYRERNQYAGTLREDVRTTYDEWRLSIWVVSIAIFYLYSINYLGFFLSSAIMLAATMKIGGVNRWFRITFVTVLTLTFIYIAFVLVLGIEPPEGLFEVF